MSILQLDVAAEERAALEMIGSLTSRVVSGLARQPEDPDGGQDDLNHRAKKRRSTTKFCPCAVSGT
jgi:Mn-containing catalase